MTDYGKRILKVLIYIENHLQDEMTVEELARIACYSEFHFQRIFKFVVGESVYQYIRRLRLEKAMSKLQYSDQSITDIALDTHFETPSAFTKAFRKSIGKSPKNYRSLYEKINMITEKKIKALPMIQPDEIKHVSEVPILFIRKTGSYVESSQIAWESMLDFIRENNLDESKLRYFSIGHDDPNITEEEKIRMDVCIQDDKNLPIKGEVSRKSLPEGKYAIFTHYGPPNMIFDTFYRIILKWFPKSKERYNEKGICYFEYGFTTKVYIPLC